MNGFGAPTESTRCPGKGWGWWGVWGDGVEVDRVGAGVIVGVWGRGGEVA